MYKEKLGFEDSATCEVIRKPIIEEHLETKDEDFKPQGTYHLEVIRDGQIVHQEDVKNLVATAGKNVVLDIAFRNQAAVAVWYLGLMDDTGFSSNQVTDTMSAHAGWAEFVAYTEVARQAWTTSAAANGAITNPTPATFNINAAGTLRGLFVTSSNTKAGTTGTLWSTVQFASTVPVQNGDQIKLTYTLNA